MNTSKEGDLSANHPEGSNKENDVLLYCSVSVTSDEELEAQKLVERGEIDQAIAAYQSLKWDKDRILHFIGVLYAERKGDHHSAIHCFQEALRIREEVHNQVSIKNE